MPHEQVLDSRARTWFNGGMTTRRNFKMTEPADVRVGDKVHMSVGGVDTTFTVTDQTVSADGTINVRSTTPGDHHFTRMWIRLTKPVAVIR